ncbi:MAG: LysM peptidoglycan-binding domain-containing protein [Acidimicrobiales bacterium]
MPSNEKAFLETETKQRIPCSFNPSELQIQMMNRWAADSVPGGGAPSVRYAGSQSGMLSLSLFFDTTADGSSVTAHTAKLMKLMEPDPSLPGSDEASGNVRPPWVVFHWGDLHSFKAVIGSLDVTFVYFAADGTPLRARAELELTQFEPQLAFAPQNPTSGTPRPHRVHQVHPGETLDRIAAAHYGDPTRWRTIAAANGIEDPLAIRPGTMLAIPRLEA